MPEPLQGELFFRKYIEVIKKDSKFLATESQIVSNSSKNWAHGYNTNKDKILVILKEKADMINKMIKAIEGSNNKSSKSGKTK